MARYLQLGKANLRLSLYPHLLLSVVLLCLSPFLMGVENLDSQKTAKVLEMYVALLGIVLLTPVFLPEQNKDIRDLVESKFTSSAVVILIRILEAGLCLIVLIGAYILILRHNSCNFPAMKFYLGTLAEALFLGGMGICAYRIFDQIAIGYMLPVMYYVMSFGGTRKYLKHFYLFSMLYGKYQDKINLAVAGVVLILIGIAVPYVSKKCFPRLVRRR